MSLAHAAVSTLNVKLCNLFKISLLDKLSMNIDNYVVVQQSSVFGQPYSITNQSTFTLS